MSQWESEAIKKMIVSKKQMEIFEWARNKSNHWNWGPKEKMAEESIRPETIWECLNITKLADNEVGVDQLF